MAFTDLTPEAQEGLTYASNQIKDDEGNPVHANARAYGDYVMESNGQEWYQKKLAARRAKRIAALDDPANAALAAQVDALGG